MYQKDYILFLIEQFTLVLKKIMAKILNREFDIASLEIERIYRQYLGLNSDLIDSIPFRLLMEMQKTSPEMYLDRCLILAALLGAEGHLFFEQENMSRSAGRLIKALNIWLTVFSDCEKNELQGARLEQQRAQAVAAAELLKRVLGETGGELPAETARLLEKSGRDFPEIAFLRT